MRTIRRRKPVKIGKVLFILSFITVPTIHFIVFYLYVNINSFTMAFYTRTTEGVIWSFDNFRRFFTEISSGSSELSVAFRNTFITFAINMAMFLVTFFVSYFLYKKIFLHKVFRICFFLPGLIAGTIVNSIYMRIVGVDGPVSYIVQKMCNLDYRPELLANSRFANSMVFLNMIWLGFPGNMILFGGTFSRIPESVLEQGRLDGVNWYQEAFRIIIPIVWPTLSLILMMSIAGIFGASGNVFLLTQGKFDTQTLSNWMFMQVYVGVGSDPTYNNAYNYLSAVGLMLTTVSVVLALVLRKYSNKLVGEVQY